MKQFRFLFGILALMSCLILSACGGESNANGNTNNNSNTGSDGVQEVKITLGEMYFKPDITTFKVGQKYRFLLVNEGKTTHEFTIAPPKKDGQTEKELDALSLLDSDDLEPGKTTSVEFTFKDAASAGTLEFECSYPGHYEGGMHTPIVVEK
jgi:uncharacterized cupredoxin-like copper-binding protein